MSETDQRASAANSWPGGIGAVTLFVEDLETAKRFYQEVFGRQATYETNDSAAFAFTTTVINLLERTAVPELIAPAVAASPEAGPRVVFSLEVDDVDVACADLASRGVELLNGPMDRPWGIRTASFLDPDGYIWEIAH